VAVLKKTDGPHAPCISSCADCRIGTITLGEWYMVKDDVWVLTASTGLWAGPSLTFSRQWYRDSATIAGQTGASYQCVAADSGHTIACRVVASNKYSNDVAFRRRAFRLRWIALCAASAAPGSHVLINIPGWLTANERRALYALARWAPGPTLEIGSRVGLFTTAIARGIKDSGVNKAFDTIDLNPTIECFDHAQMARSDSIFQISQNRLASAPRTSSKSR
jgi:hypothetical protein